MENLQKNNNLIASSTMQSKFVASIEATGCTAWLNNFIFELKVADNISKSLVLYCDNEPAIF